MFRCFWWLMAGKSLLQWTIVVGIIVWRLTHCTTLGACAQGIP